METPPLLSVFAWLKSLLGGANWAIKIWPSLAGALTCVPVAGWCFTLGAGGSPWSWPGCPSWRMPGLGCTSSSGRTSSNIFFRTVMAYGLARFQAWGCLPSATSSAFSSGFCFKDTFQFPLFIHIHCTFQLQLLFSYNKSRFSYVYHFAMAQF